MIKFTKMHGLGNDFVVIDAINQHITLTPEQIRFMSNRHFGIGFDQLLLVESPVSDNADFKYRIFNADGSEVDLCDGEGEFFVNTCWSLAEPETLRREKAAMQFGSTQWPKAKGRLIFHEYAAGQEQEAPMAMPAWRYLLE